MIVPPVRIVRTVVAVGGMVAVGGVVRVASRSRPRSRPRLRSRSRSRLSRFCRFGWFSRIGRIGRSGRSARLLRPPSRRRRFTTVGLDHLDRRFRLHDGIGPGPRQRPAPPRRMRPGRRRSGHMRPGAIRPGRRRLLPRREPVRTSLGPTRPRREPARCSPGPRRARALVTSAPGVHPDLAFLGLALHRRRAGRGRRDRPRGDPLRRDHHRSARRRWDEGHVRDRRSAVREFLGARRDRRQGGQGREADEHHHQEHIPTGRAGEALRAVHAVQALAQHLDRWHEAVVVRLLRHGRHPPQSL